MIPVTYLSKMGVYDIEIQGATLKVRVVDHVDLIDTGLSELRSQMESTKVVGLVIKFDQTSTGKGRRKLQLCFGNGCLAGRRRRSSSKTSKTLQMIQLCVGNRCLVVHLCHMEYFPESLLTFMADKEIFLVGFGVSTMLSVVQRYYREGSSGVELGDLAARVLKKPNLISKAGVSVAISTIAAEVGFPLEEPGSSKVKVDLAAPVFSHEEIKWIVRDVHASYLIGSKLLGLL